MGLTGSLGTARATPLGNPFGATTGLGVTGITPGAAFGTPLGTSALGATPLGTTGFGNAGLTSGFGSSGLGTTPGGAFGTGSTGLGGTAFGTAAQPKFQLQRPPSGNKRGKRR